MKTERESNEIVKFCVGLGNLLDNGLEFEYDNDSEAVSIKDLYNPDKKPYWVSVAMDSVLASKKDITRGLQFYLNEKNSSYANVHFDKTLNTVNFDESVYIGGYYSEGTDYKDEVIYSFYNKKDLDKGLMDYREKLKSNLAFIDKVLKEE